MRTADPVFDAARDGDMNVLRTLDLSSARLERHQRQGTLTVDAGRVQRPPRRGEALARTRRRRRVAGPRRQHGVDGRGVQRRPGHDPVVGGPRRERKGAQSQKPEPRWSTRLCSDAPTWSNTCGS